MTLLTNELKNHHPNNGKIEWIGLRKSENNTVLNVETAELLSGHGLVGDKAGQRKGGKRQVTLIQAEYLAVIASFLKRKSISPQELRRNIVVSGINLAILKGSKVQINDAVLGITGSCAPFKKMEQVFGFGGYNAMRNHGGVTAVVENGGVVSVGDKMEVLAGEDVQRRLL